VWSGRIAGEPDEASRQARGRIPADRLRIEGDDGQMLDIRFGPQEGQSSVRVTALREIGPYAFDRCPICLAPDPASQEHVPPESLGGRVRTLLCGPCNNQLGSRVEGELLDWRDDAIRHARASAENVTGRRRLPRVLRRRTPDGKFVLILDGVGDPAIEEMFRVGAFSHFYAPPDRNRYKIAALKQAYLAACLDRQEIPDTPSARVIRADLIAARDARSNRDVPVSDYALSMPLTRIYRQPHGPSLALVLLEGSDGAHEVWIALAGTVFVPWPLPDFHPRLEPPELEDPVL
jgi:hypothetical protein